MGNTTNDGLRYGGAAIGFGAIAIVGILVLGLMWTFGWGWFSQTTAEARGETSQREQTVADGGYRIASYEHFFDLCAGIQGKERTIARLEAERETADTRRVERIEATLTALRSGRDASIHSYNADARKRGTTGQFRASELPYQLDVDEEETSCEA
ncbi:hypothetical protein [Amycolatopsis cihanbeyliensis]|uniref:Uncharacterized protein n=1 Tax=Amycolatopsis cihanbeyliensis TaxID=1128664 RepID=A0A542DS98_AMYCI|nr:hypothetical protein [Amycolatopsis cihanbeyliensis]TQJ05884.1 hypothetical protein FB471_5729 [Amycolatopsis cihanbeyliensis]